MADEKDEVVENPDPHFEPLVNLPQVEVTTLEEDEDELVKLRAKLFRYDNASEPPEWKERGTGDMKILQHRTNGTCRVLMRRDKTHKVCANHYVLPFMTLKPNCGSDRAWVWSTPSDFADEESKAELLAVRFANAENAQKFKTAFDDAKVIMETKFKDKDADEIEKEVKDAIEKADDKKEKKEEKSEDKEEKVQKKDSADQVEKDTSADQVADKLGELKVEEEDKGEGDKASTEAER